ncbi:transposase [Thioflavicoccus mobilis 8321]|uniref:Transposase n=1 Tax=Thioflavicoccus mobilis 8321 TaxID=765912 RepID=L0H2D1_9GAMM|nr:IS66 family insertion sequence element accessory protein TnpB [Thioflavicoccus mobilis]AGA91749.1 transposase [Thioflavicoccus mobilis 8321]
MFFPEGRVRVFLHGRPVDMRKSFTGLIALTQQALAQDPLSGHLFVFVNRRGDYLKILYWDRSGFCLWCKRLERGRFISASSVIGADARIRSSMSPVCGCC